MDKKAHWILNILNIRSTIWMVENKDFFSKAIPRLFYQNFHVRCWNWCESSERRTHIDSYCPDRCRIHFYRVDPRHSERCGYCQFAQHSKSYDQPVQIWNQNRIVIVSNKILQEKKIQKVRFENLMHVLVVWLFLLFLLLSMQTKNSIGIEYPTELSLWWAMRGLQRWSCIRTVWVCRRRCRTTRYRRRLVSPQPRTGGS